MSTVTEDTAKKTRREAVWEVCDQLSAQGIKPSLRSVKMHYPRGSDTDVQKDVNGWFEHVFAQYARRRVIPALPDSVVQAMEAFWETASVEADRQFVKEREALEKMRAELKQSLESTQAELAVMTAARTKSDQDNVDLRLELAHRTTLLEDAEKQIAALRLDLDELRRYSQRREQDLVEEAMRLKDAHERNLKAQREDFELQVKLVREASATQAEEHQRAMTRADEHYRDLERRSLVDVDAMRTHVKSANEAIERFRALAHERDLELAGARTELRMLREVQKHSDQEIERLKADLDQMRAVADQQKNV